MKKGGIQKGSSKNNGAGTSSKSQHDEGIHKRAVDCAIDEVFGFPILGWSFEESCTLDQILINKKPRLDYAVQRDGKSTKLISDGAFVFYKNKLVGITEHKSQKNIENVVERVYKYTMYAIINRLEPWQLFVSFSGDGFNKPILNETAGGQTGAVIETFYNYGHTFTVNVSEQELENKMIEWFKKLKNKYEN